VSYFVVCECECEYGCECVCKMLGTLIGDDRYATMKGIVNLWETDRQASKGR
jgi:hypothetical protein